MDAPAAVLLSITALFIIYLALQAVAQRHFCALCAAVATTWMAGLALYWLGLFESATVLAPLMGASAVGLYYLLEKRVPEPLQIFRLPLLLTLFYLTYLLLGVGSSPLPALLVLTGLWIAFLGAYIYRENPRVSGAAKRIIACCRDW